MDPVVSIAAVTYRDLPATKRFVDSVVECTKEPFELIMVDNGSSKDVADYLDSLKSMENFHLIRNGANLGIGVAMNQAMRGCKTDYIFRCDTDIEIQTVYWTSFMREYADKYLELGAVGTSITGGRLIARPNYIETDICLSCCMLIPRRTIKAIDTKMKAEIPRVSKAIMREIELNHNQYDDYFAHLGGALNYMYNHGGYWDINFPYGADDFHYSMLIRYAGLRIAKDQRIRVSHKDESMRLEWKEERHRRVSKGFQYYRTFWEKMLDFDTTLVRDMWDCFPINKEYQQEMLRSGIALV